MCWCVGIDGWEKLAYTLESVPSLLELSRLIYDVSSGERFLVDTKCVVDGSTPGPYCCQDSIYEGEVCRVFVSMYCACLYSVSRIVSGRVTWPDVHPHTMTICCRDFKCGIEQARYRCRITNFRGCGSYVNAGKVPLRTGLV